MSRSTRTPPPPRAERMTIARLGCVTALSVLPLAGCAVGSSGPFTSAGSAFDGRYAGPFVLEGAASADICPATNTGQAVMLIRGGEARVDVAQTAYFSGRVGSDGGLILTSGQGLSAMVSGRITNGTYVATGSGDCQYQVRLTRTPAVSGSS